MANLDTLEINISTSSADAVRHIDALAESLGRLRSSVGNLGNMNQVSRNLRALSDALAGFQVNTRSVGALAELIRSMRNVNDVTISPALARQITAISDAVRAVPAGVAHRLETMATAIERLSRATQNGRGNIRLNVRENGVRQAAHNVSRLGRLWNSLRRIAFYRAIRSAIRMVTDTLQEGTRNVYAWSDAFESHSNGVKTIAEAYDSLNSASYKMGNQLGAAWASLIRALEPILLRIIDLITRAANAITQFFALLGGKTTYIKAIDYSKKWGETTASGAKAAKEWKNQLMAFDEINRLEAPSDSGGGGGSSTPDYGSMFEEVEIDSPIVDFLAKLKESVKNADWESVGAILSDGLRGVIDFVTSKIESIDFTGLGARMFSGITSFLKGFDITAVVRSLSDLLSSVLVSIANFVNGFDWGELAFAFTNFVCRAVEGIKIGKIVGSIAYLVVSIVIQIPSIVTGALEAIAGLLEDLFRKLGLDSIAGFFAGIKEKLHNARIWLKEHVVDPVVKAVKDFFGIHSPSTVFADIGSNLIEGMWNGIKNKWSALLSWFTQKWNSLKSWWQGLSLGTFHFKLPHLSWYTEEASGWVGRVLSALGLPASVPKLSVSWYAKGGVIDGASLIGVGENGAEAVVPLERNTQWISRVAAEMNRQSRNYSDSDGEMIVSALYDVANLIVREMQSNDNNGGMSFDRMAREFTRWQRNAARANG